MSVNAMTRNAAVLCLFLLALSGFARAMENEIHVLAFGDSITQGFARDGSGNWWGVGTPPRGQRISWWGYGMHLEQMIRDDLHVEGAVYNWGYGGLRSDQALVCGQDWDCIDVVLASRNADMILIMLGANDLYGGVSHTATSYNLSVMLDKSLAANILPVLGTITPNSRIVGHDDRIRHHYNPLISELARNKSIYLADQYAALVGRWDRWYTSGDGLHLNDSGNRKLAETWFNAFPTVSSNVYVVIEPAEAREAGARWRRVGTSLWRESGTMEGGVPAGLHAVEFNDVPGWRTPFDQVVAVKPYVASIAHGKYTPAGEGISDDQWIIAFYVAYWNRAADPAGLNYWLDEVRRGAIDVPGVAENFALSVEAKDMYPYFSSPETATDVERIAFVLAVYQNLLNRLVTANDEGVVYWAGELRADRTTPGAVIGNIIHAAIQAGGADWLTIWNKVQVAEYFTQRFEAQNRVWQDSDLSLARQALVGVTDDPASVEAGKARVDQLLT